MNVINEIIVLLFEMKRIKHSSIMFSMKKLLIVAILLAVCGVTFASSKTTDDSVDVVFEYLSPPITQSRMIDPIDSVFEMKAEKTVKKIRLPLNRIRSSDMVENSDGNESAVDALLHRCACACNSLSLTIKKTTYHSDGCGNINPMLAISSKGNVKSIQLDSTLIELICIAIDSNLNGLHECTRARGIRRSMKSIVNDYQ